MNSIGKLIVGHSLLGVCASASALEWARGVDIDALQVKKNAELTIFPVSSPLGCNKFIFREGALGLSLEGRKSAYAMALSAYLLGQRVDIQADPTTAPKKCFASSLMLDTESQP